MVRGRKKIQHTFLFQTTCHTKKCTVSSIYLYIVYTIKLSLYTNKLYLQEYIVRQQGNNISTRNIVSIR